MRGLLTGWGVRILIIAAIAAGAFIFRDRLSGNAGDLAVGDCFQVPLEAVEVSDVQHSPCTESHTGEVVYVGDINPAPEAYPTEQQFFDAVGTQCVPAFNAYTGRDFQSDTELDIGYFFPTTEGWADGDHELVCYAIRIDEAAMTSSLKAGQ